ncbi:MAG TPA: cell division/cell wall cluster transcriptional repressor MraZ [Acidimicrobiaceae bacterium]|nr:cell division/cell wall cluster transcriptional repressor MraZ [Acidimicrobiaceae bacterium]HAX04302.1 cell division/cell wall cluster transcriptional repressor MraZ [Acidimicrobiaceae bacterium]
MGYHLVSWSQESPSLDVRSFVRQDVDELFVGQFEHALDIKGRIVLPASFRASFDQSGFLIKGSEGCLALLTPERFRDIAQTMASRSEEGDVRHRSAKRSFGAGASRVLPDKQGRIAVPEDLRSFAQLDRDCVIVGAIDEVEIWDSARWQQITEVGDSLLESPDEFNDGGPT